MKKLFACLLTICLLFLPVTPTLADVGKSDIPFQPATLSWTVPDLKKPGDLTILKELFYLLPDNSPAENARNIVFCYFEFNYSLTVDGVSYVPVINAKDPATVDFVAQSAVTSVPDPSALLVAFRSEISYSWNINSPPLGITDVKTGYYVDFDNPEGAASVTIFNQTIPLSQEATAEDAVNAIVGSGESYYAGDTSDSVELNLYRVDTHTIYIYSTDKQFHAYANSFGYNHPLSPLTFTPGQGDPSKYTPATITWDMPTFPYEGTLQLLGVELEVFEDSTLQQILSNLGSVNIRGVSYIPSVDPGNPQRLILTATKTGPLSEAECPDDGELLAIYHATKGLVFDILIDPTTYVIDCYDPKGAISATIGEHTLPLDPEMTAKDVEARFVKYGKDGKVFTLNSSQADFPGMMTATIELKTFPSGNTTLRLVPTQDSDVISKTNDIYYTYKDLSPAVFHNGTGPDTPNPPKPPKPNPGHDPSPSYDPDPDPEPVEEIEPEEPPLAEKPEPRPSPQTGDSLFANLFA